MTMDLKNVLDAATGNANGIEIDHIAIAVRDLDVSIDWYRKNLGFNVLDRRSTYGSYTSMNSAVLRAGNAVIVLVQGVEPDSQVCRFIDRFGEGVQHIAFKVNGIRNVLDTIVENYGRPDVDILESEGLSQAFLARESGPAVRIEIIERGGGDFTDESITRLFRAFEEGDLY